MRVVFMGTPEFAASILKALVASKHEVVGCFTRPDAVRGRGKKLRSPSPVKEVAVKAGVPVYEFSSMKSDEAFEAFSSLNPDVACVAAYGAISSQACAGASSLRLPERAWLAAFFPVGGVLLPSNALFWRAMSKRASASCAWRKACDHLAATARSAFYSCSRQKCHRAYRGSSARVGVRELPSIAVLDKLETCEQVAWTEQSEAEATYAEKIAKGELDISPQLSAHQAEVRVLASSESHTCRCMVGGKSLAVLAAHEVATDMCPVPLEKGQVAFAAKRLFLGCENSILELTSVKPDGKKPMEAKAFAAGIQGIKQGGIEWQEIHG